MQVTTGKAGGDLMAQTVGLPASAADRARRAQVALVDPPGGAGPAALPVAPARIGVVIADGQGLVRAGLHALLEGEEDIEVLGEAADAHEAMAVARRLRPAVLIVDITLPGDDGGIEVAQRIGADCELAATHTVIVSAQDSDEDLFAALRAGADAFIFKGSGSGELIHAVRAVAAGDGALSPSVARRLIDEFAALPETYGPLPNELEELTPRELEVVALVAAGMTNLEIAEHLVVSPATAKTHVSRALRKVHARDRAQLVILAYESGLVAPRNPNSPRPKEPAWLAADPSSS
jgi:DNA-binding NarL/FixJ family response regulator